MSDPIIDMPSSRPGAPIDFARLTGGFWRARWLLFAVLAIGGVVGYVFAKVAMAPKYQAEAAIVWEPTIIREAAAQHRKLRTLATALELPKTLEEVRTRGGFDLPIAKMQEVIIADVLANANLLMVRVRMTDPKEAAKIANLTVEVFIEQQKEALRKHVTEIVEAAKVVRDAALGELHAARRAYDQFREQEGILDLRVERTAALEKAAILETTADHAKADLEAQIERVRVLSKAKQNVPEKIVMTETESAPAALALAEARAELEQLRGVLTEDHPRLKALASQVETLEKRMATELQPVVGQRVVARHPQRDVLENGLRDAEAAQRAAKQRETAYHDMLMATKREVAELIRLEGKAGELITDLELAEKRYGDAAASLRSAEDIARTKTTGLSPASPATAPLKPLPGRRRLLVMVAVPLLFMLIAMALIFVFHLRGLQTSSTSEIAYWGDGPVVALSPWPAREDALEELLMDLRQPLCQACDEDTLLVPFSEHETEATKKLFDALRRERTGTTNGKKSKKATRSSGKSAEAPRVALWEDGDAIHVRQACRKACRILVVVKLRQHSHFSLYQLKNRLGCGTEVAFVVVDVMKDLAGMADRVGDYEAFWDPGESPKQAVSPA